MNEPREYLAAFFILGVAALSAVAIVLIPGLFEEFQAGRLVIIAGLMGAAVGCAVAAKRNRRLITE